MESTSEERIRRTDIDVLRILATFAVVVIHNTLYSNYGDIHSINWWAAIVLNALSRWSVPVFFMLSGSTLLTYRERYSTAQFYRKRIHKVLVPFVVWTIFYLWWGNATHILPVDGPRDVYLRTVGGPAFPHLWFFYVLVGLYLVTPVLSLLSTAQGKPVVYGLIALCFVQNAVLPLSLKFFDIGVGFSIPLAAPYLGYYLLGWALKDVRPGRRSGAALAVAAAVAVAVMVGASYVLTARSNAYDLYFLGYELAPAYTCAVAAFLLARTAPWDRLLPPARARTALANVATTSLGVYLVHIVVRHYFVVLLGVDESKVWFMTAGSAAVFAASVALVSLLRRVPLVRLVVPG